MAGVCRVRQRGRRHRGDSGAPVISKRRREVQLVVERSLVQEGQDRRDASPVPNDRIGATAVRGNNSGRTAEAQFAGGTGPVRAFIVVNGQSELLEIVSALSAAGGFA